MIGSNAMPLDALSSFRDLSTVIIEGFSLVVELLCAIVLTLAVGTGFVRFVIAHLPIRPGRGSDWNGIGELVGRRLLFALELLVASDILDTMVHPSPEQLATLAAVAAIRIVAGTALTRELGSPASPLPETRSLSKAVA